MVHPTLQRGDAGSDVERLQHLLNRAGAMLKPDGDFGPSTERGVKYAQDVFGVETNGIVDDLLWRFLEEKSDPFPLLQPEGVSFIAREETGGLSYYEAVTKWPHYPGVKSGITIGVGYDLKFNSEDDFMFTWEDHLPKAVMDELLKDIGKAGTKTRERALRHLGIVVPFKSAWPVFCEKTLPEHYRRTESIYPSLEQLPCLLRSVLVSIVFNRGTSLRGESRREMKNIQSILSEADGKKGQDARQILSGVEDQILSMKRLWGPRSGLVKRRQSEANLWRKGLKEL